MVLSKLRSIVLRMFFPLAYLPIRLLRLVFHLLYPLLFWTNGVAQYKIIKTFLDWLMMIPFYLIDLLGITELYEILNELTNWKIRDILSHEHLMIQEVFNSNISVEHLRINPNNRIAKKMGIAYVSFRQVNFNEKISNDVFIHEMVHIWQYQLFGAVYIYFAWKAQISAEGYDYGKAPVLIESLEKGKLFHEFNFEQQAEIIQDYYKVANFGSANVVNKKDMAAYISYRNEMNELI